MLEIWFIVFLMLVDKEVKERNGFIALKVFNA